MAAKAKAEKEASPKTGILKVLRAYEKAWGTLDPAKLKGFWDQAEKDPWYLAEEVEAPIRGHKAIAEYWAAASTSIAVIDLKFAPPAVKLLGPGIAHVLFDMHAEFRMAGARGPLAPSAVDVKVTATLRETAEGWRFLSWAESALGPLPWVRKIYHAQARILTAKGD